MLRKPCGAIGGTSPTWCVPSVPISSREPAPPPRDRSRLSIVTVQQWVDAYAQAWRDRDADAAAALFTDDSLYRSHPLQEPHRGATGVRAYWSDVTATQDRVDVRMGLPVEASDGRRAGVEFWVRMLSRGAEVTLVGILFLRFADDGRCEDLRETWHFEPGDHAPHEGWGA